jgi:hypothetical protein
MDCLLNQTVFYAKHWFKERRYIKEEHLMECNYSALCALGETDDITMEEFTERFYAGKVVLCRGIWWDLAKLLEADLSKDYLTFFYNKSGIFSSPDTKIILHSLLREIKKIDSPIFTGGKEYDIEGYFGIIRLLSEIDPNETFKYGYSHKGNNCYHHSHYSNEYDMYEAVAWYTLSCLSHAKVDLFPRITEPDFSVLPRGNGIKDKTINNHFDLKK